MNLHPNRIVRAGWAALVGLLLLVTPLFAQTKRALVIAIGNYPGASGWQSISSANDIPLIRAALAYQKFTDVTVLQDDKATKTGIINALNTLIGQCRPGDQVVIHFSSHGQQISDDSNDELDGYDEAIVCYGAPASATAKPNYDGGQHLRDDELNQLIETLRGKLGASGDILLIADACHSGTISRGGIAKIRGNSQPFNLSGKAPQVRSAPGRQVAKPFLAPSPARGGVATGLAPYVVISAAKAGELNYEYILPDGSDKGVGSLSYVINKVLRSVNPSETYRLLFNRIVAEMKLVAPQQTPEIDGDYDRQLFGGKAVQQVPYYPIQQLTDSGKQLIIAAGRLETVNVDTQVRVCPAGTTDPMQASSFLSGTVVQAGMFSATIRLEKPLPADQQLKQWVFVTERSFGDLSVALSLDSLRNGPLRTAAENVLKALPLVKLTSVKASELYLSQLDSAGVSYALVRKTTDGFVVGKPIPVNRPTDGETISLRVQNYAQGKFLQTYNPSYPGIGLKLELIPSKPGGRDATDTLNRAGFLQNGLMMFSPTDKASVRITNTGSLRVYFSLIDIQPDGVVSVVFPTKETSINHDLPENYVIEPGKTLIIPRRLDFSPPYGTETFKVLAALEKFDLRNVVGLRSLDRGTRGLSNTLEKVFGIAQLVMRGTEGEGTLPETAVGSFSYPFLIVPTRPQ